MSLLNSKLNINHLNTHILQLIRDILTFEAVFVYMLNYVFSATLGYTLFIFKFTSI